MSAVRRVLFLLASARRNGNAERLARRAAAGLSDADGQDWVRLNDLDLPRFSDTRHGGGPGYTAPTDVEQGVLDATLAATDLVFVAPLYWYGLPASAKLYLDHWTDWLRVPGLDFKARMAGRTVWAISAYSDDDPATAEPLFGTLRLTAAYMGMGWGGSLLGRGNRPGDVEADEAALAAADALFTNAAVAHTSQVAPG